MQELWSRGSCAWRAIYGFCQFATTTLPTFGFKTQRRLCHEHTIQLQDAVQNETMRITDHRYAREIRRYNLAMRLLQLQARTQTICTWTGLYGDHVRNMAQSYIHAIKVSARHRGPPPNQPALFLKSVELRRESAALGGVFRWLGVIPMNVTCSKRNDEHLSRAPVSGV